MVDIVDKTTRSRMMAGISAKNTNPELTLRRALHARGLRFRLHNPKLPGKPDLTFRRFGAVCFVHGCFWHRHSRCQYATTPATRTEFWLTKFRLNVQRDNRSKRKLIEAGWRVAIVWECALRPERVAETVCAFDHWIRGNDREHETEPSGMG